MGKLRELSQRLGKLTPQVMEEKTLALVKVHENIATQLNTDQLYQGKDSKGKKLPEYSPASVGVFGKRPGAWQLFNEGDFYRGFFVRVESGRVLFDSSDTKTGMLLNKLDAKGFDDPTTIFGLNKANVKELSREFILPDIQGFVRKTIQSG